MLLNLEWGFYLFISSRSDTRFSSSVILDAKSGVFMVLVVGSVFMILFVVGLIIRPSVSR